ncbi:MULTISPECIES: hypothetical protein [unclassified Microbulbifer]|uniref:hypothetical protein n=1 Tax=unclassified Microbulbifer TaxID=2619833 RepID=UPI0027E581B8|nr:MULTISPECIES: hypothetical protein [unclassified Microbulbifer]
MRSAPLFLVVLLFAGAAPAGAASPQPFGKIESLVTPERARPQEWIQLLVCPGEKVTAGQKLAVQRDARGTVVQEYISGAGGEVTITGRIAPGSSDTILEIGTLSASDTCGDGDCRPAGND